MNEELIRDIVDVSANKQVIQLTGDLEKNNKALQDNIIAAKQLNDILSQSKGFADYNKNSAASAKAQEQLAKLTAARQLQEEKLAAFRASEQTKADARAAKEEANLKRIEDANNKAAAAAQKRASVTSQSEPYSGGSNGATISSGTTVNPANIQAANAANEASSQTYAQNTAAVNNNLKSKRALEIQEAKNKVATEQSKSSIKTLAKEFLAANGSIDQQRARLIRLKSIYDSISAERRNSPFGEKLKNEIVNVNSQVLNLEKSTGRAQRNVGNYTNAFASGANKAFSALRTVANILPGVGLAGLIGFAVEPIVGYIAQLDIFQKKAKDVAGSAGLISSEYTNAIKDVNSLGVSVAEFNKGTISKKELVDRFNDSIGKTVGNLKTAAEVEAFYNDKAKDYITAVGLRAQANAALELSAKKLAEAQLRAFEGPSTQDYIEGAVQGLGQLLGGGGLVTLDRVTSNAQNRTKRAVGSLTKESNNFLKVFSDLQTKADKFAKGAGLDFSKKDNGKSADDVARKNAAALIQIQIDSLKEAQEYYKQNTDNYNFSLDARLEGLKNFSSVAEQIAKLEGDREKAAKKLTSNEILAIDFKTAKAQQDIRNASAEKTVEINKQALKRQSDAIAEQNAKDLTQIEKNRDEELKSLTDSFNNGAISQETYAFRKEQIEQSYTDKYIALQIEQTKAFIEQAKLRGENTEEAESKLASIELKYADLRSKRGDKANEEYVKKKQEQFELEKQIGQEVFDLANTFIKRGSELRLNALEAESQALDKKRSFDIEQVNDSIATEEEKADRIAIINARADAQQQLIDNRVKQEKIKQAKADKAAAIAQALINGALAMTKVAAQTGVLSFAFSPLIAALTAVQIATIIAQPIPKYKDGKNKANNYSGAAWVGDGGMSELVIEPNGSMWVTPNKPMLTHVGKDTEVISGPDFKRMLAKPNSGSVSNAQGIDLSALVAEQRSNTNKTIKALKDMPINLQVTTDKGHMFIKSRIDSVKSHIGKQFGRR